MRVGARVTVPLFGDWALDVAYYRTVSGQNTLEGNEVFVGLALDFDLPWR